MATEIVLPQLGKTMKEGTLVNIRFSPGDRVAVGDILFDIETDKATLEMESEAEGVVKAVLVEAGQTVPVHTPLLILGEKGESLDSTYLAQIASHVRAAVLVDPSAWPVSDAASGSELEPWQTLAKANATKNSGMLSLCQRQDAAQSRKRRNCSAMKWVE